MKGYSSVILDVDGVLFDSNTLKHDNIRKAASEYAEGEKLEEFLSYFIFHNGLPREIKIEKYFGEGTEISQSLLNRYNELNQQTLMTVDMTPGARNFLMETSAQMPVLALSGGAEHEVKALFEKNNITSFFKGIYGGPVSKKEHIKKIPIQQPCLYVGDSKVDYETAQLVDAHFTFMTRYTQFDGWADFFEDKPEVTIIPDLTYFSRI
ncbi:MAG TPA: hypothetical protein DIU20_07310 [Cryomorphaceae bacterium]|nr:hypothetical protein [Cryomorphaceae bacterium]